jgi:hypothetical protein
MRISPSALLPAPLSPGIRPVAGADIFLQLTLFILKTILLEAENKLERQLMVKNFKFGGLRGCERGPPHFISVLTVQSQQTLSLERDRSSKDSPWVHILKTAPEVDTFLLMEWKPFLGNITLRQEC